ncbi:MAG: hypothetical protein HY282_06340 [Nitrospirae bacterium]|nr:hypothetical protein [Candidatus Manganitrophaceae bacterium]
MNIINKKAFTVPVFLIGILTLAATQARAVDFNMNTQLTDLRSDGSNQNPGFNPCRGGTRQADGSCGGALVQDSSALALLDPDNLKTVFPSLGPGAITDNMFGIVSGQDASGTPIAVTACGKVTNASLAGLNCGDLRFDPASQGQSTLLSGVNSVNNTLVAGGAGLNMNTQFVADFCAGGATDCQITGTQKDAAHTGFNITNNFNFLTSSATASIVTGSDNIRQVTAVKTTGAGTQVAPGTGDQLVVVNASWATTGGNPSSNDAAVGPSSLTVTWSQTLSDPDQSGTGSGSFTQNISGSFVYQGTAAAVSAQYPNGRTQTERSIGTAAGSIVGETLDFPLVP